MKMTSYTYEQMKDAPGGQAELFTGKPIREMSEAELQKYEYYGKPTAEEQQQIEDLRDSRDQEYAAAETEAYNTAWLEKTKKNVSTMPLDVVKMQDIGLTKLAHWSNVQIYQQKEEWLEARQAELTEQKTPPKAKTAAELLAYLQQKGGKQLTDYLDRDTDRAKKTLVAKAMAMIKARGDDIANVSGAQEAFLHHIDSQTQPRPEHSEGRSTHEYIGSL